MRHAPPSPIVRVEGSGRSPPHPYHPRQQRPFCANVGFVIGDCAALVIETGLSTRNGAAVYKVAKKLARAKALYLITTHFHPEHRPRRPSVSGDDLVDPFGRLGEGDRRVRPRARQGFAKTRMKGSAAE